MKKLLWCLIIVVFASLVLTGCGPRGGREGGPRIIRIAVPNHPDAFMAQMVFKFADTLNAKDVGLYAQVFPSSVLGDQRSATEGVQMGAIEMSFLATGALEGFDPRFIIYSMPFIFQTPEQIRRFFFETDVSRNLIEEFKVQQGLRHVAIIDEGPRHIWTRDIELNALEDFHRLVIRVPEVPLYVNMFRALGSNPTPLPLAEVYTAAQTGVVNSFEMGIDNLLANMLNEVFDIGILTSHTYLICSLLIGERFFQSLTSEQQNAVLAAGEYITSIGSELFLRSQEELFATLPGLGMRVMDVPGPLMPQLHDILEEVTRGLLGGMFDYDELVNLAMSFR